MSSTTTPTVRSNSSSSSFSSSRRRLRVGVAALAVVLGTIGSACGTGGDDPSSAADPTTTAATATTDDGVVGTVGTDPATETPTGEASPAADALVVRSDVDLAVHDAPGGSVVRTLPAANEFGSPLALLVVGGQEGWAEVLLPGRPTGATGWVAVEGVEVRSVGLRVEIDLTARRLVLLDGDETILETAVAIGAPDAPTPTGRFSLTDKIASVDPGGAYGPFALGLSARSEVYSEFAGGDGQIGIHGTNDPTSIGKDVSHGCVRVPNDVVEILNERLPLGTPVVVS